MRISDWSSDVCSSDLQDIGNNPVRSARYPGQQCRHPRTAPPHLGISRASLARGSGNQPDRRLPVFEGRRTPYAVAKIWTGRQHRVGIGQRRQSICFRLLGSQSWIDSADQGTGERSEEHTSELQSLMRISYAVFCLKKKKKLSIHY